MKKFKPINENPNAVYSDQYNVAIPWHSVRTMSFSYYNGEMYVGSGNTKHINLYANARGIDRMAEENMGRGKYAGRLFINLKIISFWDFPPSRTEFLKTLSDIEEAIHVKFSDDWRVEVPNETVAGQGEMGWGTMHPKEDDQEFIPIGEYQGGYKRSEREVRSPHEMSPLDKPEIDSPLKGSYKTAWDSKDNIISRQKRMTSESKKR